MLLNNIEREQWVMNDIQLYSWFKETNISISKFIYANKEIIDGVIKYRVDCGEK